MTTYQDRFNTSDADLTAEAQQAVNIQAALIGRVTEISGRKDLTQQAKRTAAARLHVDAQQQLQQLLAAEQKQITDQRRTYQRQAFGHVGTADPIAAMSRRQAAKDAATLDDPRTALAEYQQAEQGGDEHYAQAIAARAAQYGWSDIVTAYTDQRPKAAEALTGLAALPDTSDPQWRFHQAARYSAPNVGVLAHLDTMAINRAARDDLDVA